MSMRMSITMTQKPMLVMTPKLRQAIKILQMQRLELVQYISQEMLENPVLEETFEEVEEVDAESQTEDESAEAEGEEAELDTDLETGLPDSDVDTAPESDAQEPDISADDSGDMDWDEIDWEKYFDDDPVATKNEWEPQPDEGVRDNVAATSESLAEHLLWQLRMSIISEDDHAIGEEIIGNIDENGYLTATIEEIAEKLLFSVKVEAQCDLNNGIISADLRQGFEDNEILLSNDAFVSVKETDAKWLITDGDKVYTVKKQEDELNIYAEVMDSDVAEVERVLLLIQTFEPTGVGARDLRECLLIQLQQLGLQETIAYAIVEKNHLEDLGANRFPQIAKELGVELDLVREAANDIATLESKPGRQFSSEKPEYVIPDVTVEKVDGRYRVFVNDYGPIIRLNPYYRNMLSSKDSLSDEEREYIHSKIQSAEWLLESIASRRVTIQRVTESIFDVQRDFLEKGASYIKPLTLKDIADTVGVHESTVSRVTRGRYVQTPRGVFPLKYFFNSAIPTESGGATSSASVKEMIKDMVSNEDPHNPLSDKEIETKLRDKGIEIARRTIAKYRGELNIPPSSKRKKW
jgi:RNA polymerase sigma-54 factor